MDARALSIGARSSNKGSRGISKRLGALRSITPLIGGRLLDVGCADGSYTRRLADGFARVDAIDIEPLRLADFRRALDGSTLASKVFVREMSADALDFDDGAFDAVSTIEVLEHVGDLDATIREIHRVLKPGGRLLITSPNRWFPFETHGVLIGNRRRAPWVAPGLPWLPPLHARLSDARAFTVDGLTRRLGRLGFGRVGYTYIMPPFDRHRLGRRIRTVSDAVETSPLSFTGMALIMVFCRCADTAARDEKRLP